MKRTMNLEILKNLDSDSKLRDYQNQTNKECLALFAEHKRLLMIAPTGAGKTFMFTYLIKELNNYGFSSIVITHRIELLTQAGGSLDSFNLNYETVKAGKKSNLDEENHIAMIETLYKRLQTNENYRKFLLKKDFIVVDEAHLQDFNKVFKYFSIDSLVLGVTATPVRPGTKQESLRGFYENMIESVDIPTLIDQGYLAKPKSYGVEIDLKGVKKTSTDYKTQEYYSKNKVYEGVIENYQRITPGKKAIAFTANVKSAEELTNKFVESGYPCKKITGKSKDRRDILKWFNNTHNAILVNCGVLTAGFDQPDIEVVILYRATTSLSLFLQMVGRGSRVTEKKKEFTILDFGNNIQRLGFWEEKRKWILDKDEIKKKDKLGEAAVKNCPSCGAMVYASIRICPECGSKFKMILTPEQKAKLVELKYCRGGKIKLSQCSPEELFVLMKRKKIKPGYAYRVARSHGEYFLKRLAAICGYKEGWIEYHRNQNKSFYDKYVEL